MGNTSKTKYQMMRLTIFALCLSIDFIQEASSIPAPPPCVEGIASAGNFNICYDDNECGQYGHCEGHDIENQIPGKCNCGLEKICKHGEICSLNPAADCGEGYCSDSFLLSVCICPPKRCIPGWYTPCDDCEFAGGHCENGGGILAGSKYCVCPGQPILEK